MVNGQWSMVNEQSVFKRKRKIMKIAALSLRATPIPVMHEILEAWFSTSSQEGEAQSEWNLQQMARLRQLEDEFQV